MRWRKIGPESSLKSTRGMQSHRVNIQLSNPCRKEDSSFWIPFPLTSRLSNFYRLVATGDKDSATDVLDMEIHSVAICDMNYKREKQIALLS